MALTRNQELITLIANNTRNKKDITNINFNIISLNSSLVTLKDQYDTIKDTLEKLSSRYMNPSFEHSSYQEDIDYSHFQKPHSNHLHHEMHLPRFEVKEFDGSDPTSWDTQMEHYLSLHGITDKLAKFHYGLLYMDVEHCQWLKWHKNSRQGYVSWTHFVAKLYECFDTNTHNLVHLTKLKQYGIVEDFIFTFEHLDFRTEGIPNAFFMECFIDGLKDEI
jgi:hypothetical protein